jgi:hypothetical protein
MSAGDPSLLNSTDQSVKPLETSRLLHYTILIPPTTVYLSSLSGVMRPISLCPRSTTTPRQPTLGVKSVYTPEKLVQASFPNYQLLPKTYLGWRVLSIGDLVEISFLVWSGTVMKEELLGKRVGGRLRC